MTAFTPEQETRLREIIREEIKADQDRRAQRAQDLLRRLGTSGALETAEIDQVGSR